MSAQTTVPKGGVLAFAAPTPPDGAVVETSHMLQNVRKYAATAFYRARENEAPRAARAFSCFLGHRVRAAAAAESDYVGVQRYEPPNPGLVGEAIAFAVDQREFKLFRALLALERRPHVPAETFCAAAAIGPDPLRSVPDGGVWLSALAGVEDIFPPHFLFRLVERGASGASIGCALRAGAQESPIWAFNALRLAVLYRIPLRHIDELCVVNSTAEVGAAAMEHLRITGDVDVDALHTLSRHMTRGSCAALIHELRQRGEGAAAARLVFRHGAALPTRALSALRADRRQATRRHQEPPARPSVAKRARQWLRRRLRRRPAAPEAVVTLDAAELDSRPPEPAEPGNVGM